VRWAGPAQLQRDVGGLGEAWNRFWFAPRSTAPLVFLRIALGLVTVVWAATLLPDARAFLGPEGIVQDVPDVRLRVGLLQLFRSDLAAVLVVALLVPAGLAVALGWRTRAATIVCFVLLLSIARRDTWILNSGDALLRHAMLFLAMTPAGAAVSLDRWRTARDRFWEVPHASPWGLRLIQIQLTFVYLFSSFEKLRGEPWTSGTALADAWRLADLARAGIPLPVYDSLLVTNVLTYTTLLVEVALAVLLWNRVARPYVVVAGVLLHLGIEVSMAVGFFSTVAVTLYLSFTEPRTAERWLTSVRRRLARAPVAALRRLAAASPPDDRAPSRAATGPRAR
jgi:hypothetical protein